MSDARDYLQEARRIMKGNSLLLPETAHLLALKVEHDRQLVAIGTYIALLKREVVHG